jgi:exosome complex RNA-binding protein Rrp42 (RNase PH superfamily)
VSVSLSVQLQILKSDGNPLDACSVASYLSLQCCKIPKVDLFEGDGGNVEDFDVSGDLADSHYFDVRTVPILMSAYKLGTAEGTVFVLDAAEVEQQAASNSLSVAFDRELQCCGVVKTRSGMMEPDDLAVVMQVRYDGCCLCPFMYCCCLDLRRCGAEYVQYIR